MPSPSLLDLSYDALESLVASLGQPAYRAGQIWHALYRDLAASTDDMTTLPKGLRAALAAIHRVDPLEEIAEQRSADGRTRKRLYRLEDGETVESVTMAYDDRCTVCVSTQVGCPMNCKICATGQSGFVRNLSVGEIVSQALDAARAFAAQGDRLSNLVYMGMGEPFANYEATLGSIRVLNDPRGFRLGARSFTISTVGVVPGIERLAREGVQVNLAVSLHAADDALRSELVPANRTYPLARLLEACRTYVAETNRRITFEMALIDGVNDGDVHARRAADLLAGLLCHVNLIPFNPVPGRSWTGSRPERITRFSEILSGAGIPVSVRHSRGSDIEAGCGQLRERRGR